MIRQSKPILFFALPLCVIGAIVFYSSLGFFHFAAFVVVYAVVYPILFAPLPKTEADYWYYLLGIVGLIAFYNAESIDEDVFVTQTLLAEARDRVDFLHRFQASPAGFLEQEEVKSLIFETLRLQALVRSSTLTERNESCDPLEPEPCEAREVIIERADAVVRSEGRPARLVTPMGAQEVFLENTVDLSPLRDDTTLTLISIPSIELYAFYYGPSSRTSERGSTDAILESLDSIVFIEEEYLRDMEERLDDLTQFGRPSRAAMLFANLWPFFLCAALGLKLARTRFTA